MSDNRKPLQQFRAPRYWPAWIGMGALRIVCLLPHRVALCAPIPDTMKSKSFLT